MKQLSGPYLSRRQAKNIIQAMIETYPLRTCTDYEFSKRKTHVSYMLYINVSLPAQTCVIKINTMHW